MCIKCTTDTFYFLFKRVRFHQSSLHIICTKALCLSLFILGTYDKVGNDIVDHNLQVPEQKYEYTPIYFSNVPMFHLVTFTKP